MSEVPGLGHVPDQVSLTQDVAGLNRWQLALTQAMTITTTTEVSDRDSSAP
ncbi:hypothetical protein AB0C27_53765 [Nonomuraea sp. NPDC048882]|uniref:hypothetical protein n=1 Tax=Nonomuraea sp. NPDC048882 TaxID=3154347 RepID=UPI00340CD185